jgi:hypothetical protein
MKNYFLVVLDYFSYKNGPIDLVRGLFSSLDIGTCILHICRPLCTYLVQLGHAQMPQNSIKKHFLVVSYYFSYQNRPIDVVRGLPSSLDIEKYIPPTCGPSRTFLGPCWGAQMPQNSMKTNFLVVLDHFNLKNGPNDMVPKGPKTAIQNYFRVVLDYLSYKNGPNDWVKGLFLSLDIRTYILPTCGPL